MTISLVFNIFMAAMTVIYIAAVIFSLIKHRDKYKMYTVLTRPDGRVSKVAIAFWFILPVIIFQSIAGITVSPVLENSLYAILAAEVGTKGIEKINIGNKNDTYNNDYNTNKNDKKYTRRERLT